MQIKRYAVIIAIAALGFSIGACGGDNGGGEATPTPEATFQPGTTMDRLNKAQKIVIGTKFDQPGFGLKGLSGEPEGFDVEIGKIIANEMGIPAENIEWVETPSKVREDYITQNKVDMVVATYTINDTRKQRVDFAGPYYVAGQTIMVRSDDNSITGPDSFKAGTKKVCSVTGSTPAENIKKYVKDVGSQLVLFDTYDKCRDALKGGQVDAVTTDNVILLGYVAEEPDALKLVGQKFTVEPYGVGVKKGDTQFRAFINDTLEKAYKDGRWQQAWNDTAGKTGTETASPPPVDRY